MNNMTDAQMLKRGYHALSMLTMHAAGNFNLREDKYDEYVDVLVRILEIANDAKYRLRTYKPEL